MGTTRLLCLAVTLLAVAASVCAQDHSSSEEVILRSQFDDQGNPDAVLPTDEIIRRHGYPSETHLVTTEDGYVLTMHRIPRGRNSPGTGGNRPVVFLQHCLLCSSSVWVFMGPENGLAFILADQGFDVWMGNARGNEYSRRHVLLDPKKSQFWDFSWNEMGYYDLPAEFDYVLSLTGQPKLSYVGFSMGTTMFFAMGASRPEYNTRIRSMHAFAPVAFVGKMKSPIKLLHPFLAQSNWIANMLGMDEFLPSSDLMSFLGKVTCEDDAKVQPLCSNILFLLSGYNSEQLNTTTLPVIFGHLPAGCSAKTVMHYAQGVLTGDFRLYDYGLIGNLKRYGSAEPPEYDLGLVTAPVNLHYSSNDWLANVEDVKKLADKLPNLKKMILVPEPRFNHMDYLLAIDVRSLLYDSLVQMLKNEVSQ
ncbi:lipase 3-like isoform X1 [Ischnura elegans]|uniref:lipase 3-like isoform X1 n=1 Tax=Ischnura elegans TaxID=197161 RepID=UPI001ED88313|nr:lipase 3-like isoform X1 [Ischnura elegans]